MKKMLLTLVLLAAGGLVMGQCPTITLGPNPSLCYGGNTSLTYTATTGGADSYRIDWDAAANAAGLVDYAEFVGLGPAPGSIMIIGVPSPGTYSGQIFVKNSASGCESPGFGFQRCPQ